MCTSSRSKRLFGCLLCVVLFAVAGMRVTIRAEPDSVPGYQIYLPVVTIRHSAVRFAVIGDYGLDSEPEADVARMVKSWEPDLVLTTGDNNHDYGEASTIDRNIGKHYCDFIYPYYGRYDCPNQKAVNRFFPTLGNHDWLTQSAQPYLDYFTLPGNERYYDFRQGPVHFFALDTDPREPHGRSIHSQQAHWLRERLASSKAAWKIVYMHHPPFSSGSHGSVPELQWPYHEWGATAVLTGHDHVYERIVRDGSLYFVNGLGGSSRYPFKGRPRGSEVKYREDYGAMLVEANNQQITFRFYTRTGELVDEYRLTKE
jgi:tartrate-resistant acid phosphatase type 5